MTTIVFNCNDLSGNDGVYPRTFTTWLGGKDVRDNNNRSASLSVQIQLTKGLKDRIEQNGVINIEW